ncbi:MAG: transposase [Burkholderiales bacterium]
MPRHARFLIPGVATHVIQRGNNRSPCFYEEADYRYFLKHLGEQAGAHGCAIHAYCLMTNHVHLLLTPGHRDSLSGLMKALGQRYVLYINRSYERTGTLWEGRYHSGMMKDEAHVLCCYRYIELNPVRAGMVDRPEQYRWSSYRANAGGTRNPLLTGHPNYMDMGECVGDRSLAYRRLCAKLLEDELVENIRRATRRNAVAEIGGDGELGTDPIFP